MDSILLLLALFSLLKLIFSVSLLDRPVRQIAYGIGCALFIFLCHDTAITQSKLALEEKLANIGAITDISVIVMLDLLITIGALYANMRIMNGNSCKRFFRILRYIPGLLIFPALYYLHLNLFFRLPGSDFETISITYAITIALLVGGFSILLPQIIREQEQRLEITGMVSLMIFALAICCTVFHPSSVVHSQADPVDWPAFGLATGFIFILFLTGILLTVIKNRLKYKHQ